MPDVVCAFDNEPQFRPLIRFGQWIAGGGAGEAALRADGKPVELDMLCGCIDLPPELVSMLWGGRFRGQTQKWFLLRFTGEDSEIDIATEHPEFLEWKWVELDQVPRLIVPFKRAIYEDVVAEFRPVIEQALEEPKVQKTGSPARGK